MRVVGTQQNIILRTYGTQKQMATKNQPLKRLATIVGHLAVLRGTHIPVQLVPSR